MTCHAGSWCAALTLWSIWEEAGKGVARQWACHSGSVQDGLAEAVLHCYGNHEEGTGNMHMASWVAVLAQARIARTGVCA